MGKIKKGSRLYYSPHPARADCPSFVSSMYCSAAYYWLYAVIQSKKNTSGNVVIVVTPARDGAPAKTMSKNDYDMMHLGEMFQVSSAPRLRAQEPARTALEPELVCRP